MKRRRTIQLGCGLCLLLLFFLLIAVGVTMLTAPQSLPNNRAQTTTLNATVYLTQDTLLQPLQAGIDQKLPQIASSEMGSLASIFGITSASEPTAKVTSLTPQTNGLNANLSISLYPGASPINTSLLVTFKVLNSSTLQVNGQTYPNSLVTYNGQLTTIPIPALLGKLTSIQTTSSCGKAVVAVNLQIPVNLGQASTQNAITADKATTSPTVTTATTNSDKRNTLLSFNEKQINNAQSNVYAEIPESSLAALSAGIGTLDLNSELEATNIRPSLQNGKLVISTDIYTTAIQDRVIKVGTTITTIEPQVENGKLQMHVVNTNLHVLFFNFPINNYNQQIEQTLNNKISSALGSNLNLNGVSIGPNSQIPCAASNSLLLSVAANIG
jgi:hypothetical protein